MYTHEVAVVEHDTERTVKAIKVESQQRAEQIERGVNINLDHRFYYTEVRALVEGDR
jgi:hypothetical protein